MMVAHSSISVKVFDDFDDVIEVCAVFSGGEGVFFVVKGFEELEFVFVKADPDFVRDVVHGCLFCTYLS